MSAEIRRKCEDTVKNGQRKGEPCRNNAVIGSDPPRCGSHPADGKKVTHELTAERRTMAKELFLTLYRESGDEYAAAKAVGYAVKTIRDWRFDDTQFKDDWEAARFDCVVDLEQCLFARGKGLAYEEVTSERRITGEDENGDPIVELVVTKVVTKVKHDTPAAVAWLKGNEPVRYRDSKFIQPDEPRQVLEEALLAEMMADPAIAAAMDAIYDADLD